MLIMFIVLFDYIFNISNDFKKIKEKKRYDDQKDEKNKWNRNPTK